MYTYMYIHICIHSLIHHSIAYRRRPAGRGPHRGALRQEDLRAGSYTPSPPTKSFPITSP